MDDLRLRTVSLVFRPEQSKTSFYPSRDREAWISMIEMVLSSDYKDYTITMTQDSYSQTTEVVVLFASVDDATFFRLQHGR